METLPSNSLYEISFSAYQRQFVIVSSKIWNKNHSAMGGSSFYFLLKKQN